MDIGKMMQMISTLGSLKESRLNREQRVKEHETQKEQAAAQLGFNVKSQEFKTFMDLAKLFDEGSPELKARLGPVIAAFDIRGGQAEGLAGAAAGAPSTTRLRDQEAWAGLASATPEARAQAQAESYSGAASGMTRGGIAASGLQGDLMGNARNVFSQLTPQGQNQLGVGVLGQQAKPLSGGVEMAGGALSPEVLSVMARIQGGTQMSAPQVAANALGVEGQRFGQWATTQQLSNQEVQMMLSQNKVPTAADLVAISARLIDIAKALGNPKLDDASKLMLMTEQNQLRILQSRSQALTGINGATDAAAPRPQPAWFDAMGLRP
jgi:hypothetical protein